MMKMNEFFFTSIATLGADFIAYKDELMLKGEITSFSLYDASQ